MRRIVLILAIVAVLVLGTAAPAMAQRGDMAQDTTGPPGLPKSGGMESPSVLLPATAMLVGTGVLAYLFVRRR